MVPERVDGATHAPADPLRNRYLSVLVAVRLAAVRRCAVRFRAVTVRGLGGVRGVHVLGVTLAVSRGRGGHGGIAGGVAGVTGARLGGRLVGLGGRSILRPTLVQATVRMALLV